VGVSDTHACFEDNLEKTVRREIGEGEFDGLFESCKDEFEFGERADALKNPYIFGEVLRRAYADGKVSETLVSIVQALVKMKPV
jgi:hypothetical protein